MLDQVIEDNNVVLNMQFRKEFAAFFVGVNDDFFWAMHGDSQFVPDGYVDSAKAYCAFSI